MSWRLLDVGSKSLYCWAICTSRALRLRSSVATWSLSRQYRLPTPCDGRQQVSWRAARRSTQDQSAAKNSAAEHNTARHSTPQHGSARKRPNSETAALRLIGPGDPSIAAASAAGRRAGGRKAAKRRRASLAPAPATQPCATLTCRRGLHASHRASLLAVDQCSPVPSPPPPPYTFQPQPLNSFVGPV